MKVTLDREGINVVRVSLELEAEMASRAYEFTCRELSNRIAIPGFRRGKAPRNIIEKQFGRDAIKREALDRLIPDVLQQVITDKNLDTITSPEIEECKFELGEPLTLRARFEVRPEVELGDYKTVSVNVPEAVLPEDAMDRALNSIAENKSRLSAIEPRDVVMGDHIMLDFECYVDDKLIEGGKAEGLTLEVKEGAFVPGFCEQLVGKKPSEESIDVAVTFPDDYRNPALKGKPANFKVTIKEIREKVIPAIDDELAKEVGHETLEALKEELERRMKDDVEQENQSRAQKAVVDAVVEGATVEIPESMIEREHDLLMRQVQQYLEQGGQSWEEFEKSEEFEPLKSSKSEEARQRVLHSLVLGAVVSKESLTVTEDELGPYLAQFAMQNQIPPERYSELAQNEYFLRQATEELLTNKVIDLLMDGAKVNYVPDTSSAEGSEGADKQTGKEDGGGKKAKAAAKKPAAKKADDGGSEAPEEEAREEVKSTKAKKGKS